MLTKLDVVTDGGFPLYSTSPSSMLSQQQSIYTLRYKVGVDAHARAQHALEEHALAGAARARCSRDKVSIPLLCPRDKVGRLSFSIQSTLPRSRLSAPCSTHAHASPCRETSSNSNAFSSRSRFSHTNRSSSSTLHTKTASCVNTSGG